MTLFPEVQRFFDVTIKQERHPEYAVRRGYRSYLSAARANLLKRPLLDETIKVRLLHRLQYAVLQIQAHLDYAAQNARKQSDNQPR
jgi:hypothetical protein